MNTYSNFPEWLTEGYPHSWHPYTQMHTAPLPLPVSHAEGAYIYLENGRALLDGISSWWTMCHGYNHPHIKQTIAEQLDKLPHVMFAGLAHEPAYTLASRLSTIAPEGLNRVFFSDSGSVAVEVAMKMAVQFWRNHGDKNKAKFISFRHCYHGDTLGAMSLSDPDHSMHHVYNNYAPKQYLWDIPSDEYSFNEFDELIQAIKKTTAAVIIEPLVQCAGGMKFHSPDVLAEIYRLCKKHDILMIADEIATGFCRTGSFFACNEAGITPDILCLGKALTGGFLPLAATLATEAVFQEFSDEDGEKALMHGPTFMANPLACAAANASLDIFEKADYLPRIEEMERLLSRGLAPCRYHRRVKDVRVKGAIGAVECSHLTGEEIATLREFFINQGIWLRPFDNLIYLMPPFILSDEEIERLTSSICQAVELLK